jgi:hypothetical protein
MDKVFISLANPEFINKIKDFIHMRENIISELDELIKNEDITNSMTVIKSILIISIQNNDIQIINEFCESNKDKKLLNILLLIILISNYFEINNHICLKLLEKGADIFTKFNNDYDLESIINKKYDKINTTLINILKKYTIELVQNNNYEELKDILYISSYYHNETMLNIIFDNVVDLKLYNNILKDIICPQYYKNEHKNNNALIIKLINKDADVFVKFQQEGLNMNILHVTTLSNNVVIIEYILNYVRIRYPKKFNDFINEKDLTGSTPLIRAIGNNSIESAIKLINYNADVNLYDNEKRSPFWIASSIGNITLVSLLFEKGANINHLSISGKSPRFIALLSRNYEIAKFIEEKEGIINYPVIPKKNKINFNKLYNNDETFINYIKTAFDSIESVKMHNSLESEKIWNKIAEYVIYKKEGSSVEHYFQINYDSSHSGSSWGAVKNEIYSISVNGISQNFLL